MSRRLIVDDLINDVRSLIDQDNTESVSDTDDILPALNRGQDFVSNILARHYVEPLLDYTTQALTSGTYEYDIPEAALEQRLEKVEIVIPNSTYPEVRRISFRDISEFETTSEADIPDVYAVVGTKYRLLPPPTGLYDARIWYPKRPEFLVKSQGRITVVNSSSNYLIVDALGADLTTSAANLNCYISVIDGQSGLVKGNYQIQSLDSVNSKITIKAAPDRTSVLNKTIASSLASTVEVDDYVCTIHGSCVPFIKQPFSNFVIQYAVNQIKGIKLEENTEFLQSILKECEKQVEHTWVGREQSLRVKMTNPIWGGNGLRRRNLIINGN